METKGRREKKGKDGEERVNHINLLKGQCFSRWLRRERATKRGEERKKE